MIDTAPYESRMSCRVCLGGPLHDLIAFGVAPIADRLIDPTNKAVDLHAPLTLTLCPDCGLVQLRETVQPEYLFYADYPYYSSVSPALTCHFHSSADDLISRLKLGSASFVVEGASNDGYMLKRFQQAGIPVLGVDPAAGPVQAAKDIGINTIQDFFSAECARGIVERYGRADLFLANNVLAHVADTNDFVSGVAELLAPDGIAVFEFPYLLDLIDNCAFDTIYHQHLLYFTVRSAKALFARHGLYLNDVERLAVHGGSLRVVVGRHDEKTKAVDDLLQLEADRQADKPTLFRPLLEKMAKLRADLHAVLQDYRERGIKVAGYGAAAKATTFMHYFGVTKSDLVFIADKSPWKQGLSMPGTQIPIVSPETLNESDVEAVLILAWNFANEIISENTELLKAGRKFVVPIPDVTVADTANFRTSL